MGPVLANLQVTEGGEWQRSSAHTAAAARKLRPPTGSGWKARRGDKRAGGVRGVTGDGPAGRGQVEQAKERQMGGCGEQNLPVTVSGVQRTLIK